MTVFNRRNALFGWVAWNLLKQQAKSKARKELGANGGGLRVGIPAAVVAATAAIVGFLLFWRRRRPSGADEYGQ